MHRTLAAALVMALALAFASCGGGGGTRTVGRAELVRRLEAACLAGQRVAREQMKGERSPRVYLSAIVADQKYVLGKIGTLETSGPARTVFDGFKDTMRRRLVALERVRSASRADFPRAVAQERPLISASGPKAHAALVALGARHVCL